MRVSQLFASSLIVIAACGGDDTKINPNTTAAPRGPAPVVEPPEAVDPMPIATITEPAVVVPAPDPLPEPTAVPETYAELMQEGRERRADGDIDAAVDMFERASELRSKAGKPHTELARVYLAANDVQRARAQAELSIEKYDASSAAWNTLGRVELAEGDLDAAAASFERATEANEDNSYAWNNLGYTLIQRESYADAADALERATSGATVTAYMWNNLGMAYEHLDRVVQARAAYEQAAEQGSKIAASHFERLDGVTSIAKATPDGDADDGGTDVALDPDLSVEIE